MRALLEVLSLKPRYLTLFISWLHNVIHYPIHTLHSPHQFQDRLELHSYQGYLQLLSKLIPEPFY